MKAIIVSNLTIDHNSTESGTFEGSGGPAFFCGKTFGNLNVEHSIVSPYGTDFPKQVVPASKIIPSQPTVRNTLVFKNVFHSSGIRTQSISNYNNSFDQLVVDEVYNSRIGNADVVIIAPILPNIGIRAIKHLKSIFPSAWFVLLPQGFYRKVEADNSISYFDWVDSDDILGYFDIVIYSDEDDRQAEKKAIGWSRGGRLVVVTKGERGCSVFNRRRREDFHAFTADSIIDSTGAGDIFAASFVYNYQKTRSLEKAAVFANASASISLRFTPDKLQYRLDDIIDVSEGE